jgi:hypothetical protein
MEKSMSLERKLLERLLQYHIDLVAWWEECPLLEIGMIQQEELDAILEQERGVVKDIQEVLARPEVMFGIVPKFETEFVPAK